MYSDPQSARCPICHAPPDTACVAVDGLLLGVDHTSRTESTPEYDALLESIHG